MEEHKGEFELLMKDIMENIDKGVEWEMSAENTLIVYSRITTNPAHSCNGGDYTVWQEYASDGFGVTLYDADSSDWGTRKERIQFECIVGGDGLKRLAQLATVMIAAKSLVAKEKGSFGKLKAAVRALN